MPKISYANNLNPLKQFYTDQQTKKAFTNSIKDHIKEQQEKKPVSVREKDKQRTVMGQSGRKENIQAKTGQTSKKENQQNTAKVKKNPKEHQSKRSILSKKIDIYA
jgi:hypothetical protein